MSSANPVTAIFVTVRRLPDRFPLYIVTDVDLVSQASGSGPAKKARRVIKSR